MRLCHQLELENAYLIEEVLEATDYGEIIGSSPALENILRQIEMVSPTDASVLITGESGTGKELVADMPLIFQTLCSFIFSCLS